MRTRRSEGRGYVRGARNTPGCARRRLAAHPGASVPLPAPPANAWPPLSKTAILVSVRWHLIMLGSVLSRILYF